MKTQRLLIFPLLALFLTACGTFNLDFRKLDTPDKQYQFVQEEWIDALTQYKAFLDIATPEEQEALHKKFDEPIKTVALALDLWGTILNGGGDTATAQQGFLDAKNRLLRLGFEKFYGGAK